MNERFPPKGTPIKSFFFLVIAVARLDYLLSFFRFFFWKNYLRSEAKQTTTIAGNEKSEPNKNVQLFKNYGYEHHWKTDKRCGSTHIVK